MLHHNPNSRQARRGAPRPLAAVGLVLLVAGCASGPVLTPASGPVPDLKGTWTGTWGGGPLTVIVAEQRDAGPSPGGVHIGGYQVFGESQPTVSGVMTATVRGEPLSVAVQGWVGFVGPTLSLVLEARPGAGIQRLTLRGVGEERLVGTGESSFRWGPQGKVELARGQPAPTPR